MKRRLLLELNIDAILYTESERASSATVNLRPRTSEQFSLEELEAYSNFIRTIISIIRSSGFDIVNQYQSNRRYSYYVELISRPYEGFGDLVIRPTVKFGLSDHQPNGIKVSNESESKSVIFKSFVVEGVEHKNIKQVILDIQQICNDLKVGDYSRLM